MTRNLKDLVVVITGGAEGVGYNIAKEFLKQNIKALFIIDINESKGQVATEELKKINEKIFFIKCDVTKDLEEVYKKITNKYEQVDVVVNNAGITNESSPRKTLETNAIGLIEWTRRFWEHMRIDKNGKGGTILNIASIYGFTVDPFVPVYKASKFAVMGFTKSLGHQDNFKVSGVRVMALCPGFTRTNMTQTSQPDSQMFRREEFIQSIKEQKWQDADVVGAAAVEVFMRADSGTAWKIEGGEPIEQV